MKKNIVAIFLSFLFLAINAQAAQLSFPSSLPKLSNCPQVSTTNPSFCPLFKATATCYCISSGLPAGMCQDINVLYGRMIAIFGSQQRACEFQKDDSVQNCMDDWNCYLRGGRNSQGGLCGSTGSACK